MVSRRLADEEREREIAAQVAVIRAQAVRNRAAELGITVGEAERIQREVRAFEAAERLRQTSKASATHVRGDDR